MCRMRSVSHSIVGQQNETVSKRGLSWITAAKEGS